MDYGKSGEHWDESLEDDDDWDDIELEEDIEPHSVTVCIQFKSGRYQEWTLQLPKTSPAYDTPITKNSIVELVTNAYSFGESPFIILPLDDGTQVFIDLSATDFMELK